ncbi:hypothetical protein D6825_03450 [Candidatus Woesearchaeota archaeon]|nr:MAG: hypothetical protein D6825_03450 [Candidatus Woesearchaeota archaeon]
MNWKNTIALLSFAMALLIITANYPDSTQLTKNPTGLSICKDCKRIFQKKTPDHSLFLLTLLLAIIILSSHTLNHYFKAQKARKALIALFISSFVILSLTFTATIALPHSSISLLIRRSASVISAVSILALFTIIGVEVSHATDRKN